MNVIVINVDWFRCVGYLIIISFIDGDDIIFLNVKEFFLNFEKKYDFFLICLDFKFLGN